MRGQRWPGTSCAGAGKRILRGGSERQASVSLRVWKLFVRPSMGESRPPSESAMPLRASCGPRPSPPSSPKGRGCLRVSGDLRVPSSAPRLGETQRPPKPRGRRDGFAEPSDQGRRTQPAHSNDQREAARLPLCSAEPLCSFFSGVLPRAGVLNAESRRNAEVPRDASQNAAGRADHASQHDLPSRPDNQPLQRSRVVASTFRATSAFHPLRRKGGTQRPRKPRGRLDASRSHRINGEELNRPIPTSDAKPRGCLCVPPSLWVYSLLRPPARRSFERGVSA